MNKILVLSAIVGLLAWSPVRAQDADTTAAWSKSAVGSVFLTQSSYDNWTGGGEDNTTFKAQFDVEAESNLDRVAQSHAFQFAFGQSKVGDLGYRKVDDLLHYTFVLTYPLEGKFRPVLLSVDARSQLAKGFDYKIDPEQETLISKFLAPGYITESSGVEFDSGTWFKSRLGLAAKQTIVLDEALRDPDQPGFAATKGYGNDPDESVRFEAGFDLGFFANRPIWDNVILKSELNLFGSFSQLSEPDIRWKNLFTFKINEYLNANFDFELFYDKDQSDDVQLRQGLSLGLSYTFL